MIYFLTHTQKSQQDSEQEVSETFSRANLIATTPKGVVWLILGVVALASITFILGVSNSNKAQEELEIIVKDAIEKQKLELSREYLDQLPRCNPVGSKIIPIEPPNSEGKTP